MSYGIIIAAVVGLGGMGILFAVGLAAANAKFAVKRDRKAEAILEALPGANCGACGLAGCAAYAEAVAAGEAAANLCAPGGQETVERIAEILGVKAQKREKSIAIVHCNRQNGKKAADYAGLEDCKAAALFGDAVYECAYACTGLGTCVRACPFGAIVMSKEGLPVIMEEKCTACGVCVQECPKDIISIESAKSFVHILCRSQEKGAVARRNCERACIGCGKCAKVCPVEAIEIKDFLARIDYEKCISCGKCVKECPTGAIGNYRQMRRRRADVA